MSGTLQEKAARKARELQEKSIPKLLFGYAVTTFFALFLNGIYSLTDALFVGHGVGIEALGAVSAIFPFAVFQGAVSTTIGGGAAILVSKLLGQKRPEQAGGTVLSAAVLFWSVAVVTSILGLVFLEPLLNLLGVSDGLREEAKQYLTIILIGNVFSTGFSSVMRAEGKMFYALLQWVIPISVNIALDAVFVLTLNLGVKGAAYATVCSQILSVFMAAFFFIKVSSIQFRGAQLRLKTMGDVVSSGFPSLIQQGAVAVGLALLNSVFKKAGGEQMQIVYGIVNKLFMICIIPFGALTQALQPIAGYNFGAGETKRVSSAMRCTILFSAIAALVPMGICLTIPHYLVRIFTNDAVMIESAAYALRAIALSLPFLFLPSAVGSLFQAIGKKMLSSLLYAVNYLFIPPFAAILALHSPSAVWFSFAAAGIIATLISVVPLIKIRKKLI